MTVELTQRPTAADDDPGGADEPDGAATGSRTVELSSESESVALSVPDDANDAEAAAIAAAVAAHLASEDRTDDEESEQVDRWKLSARFGSRRRARLPTDCGRGQEWKLAGRCSGW